jgi:hypothetical protein
MGTCTRQRPLLVHTTSAVKYQSVPAMVVTQLSLTHTLIPQYSYQNSILVEVDYEHVAEYELLKYA